MTRADALAELIAKVEAGDNLEDMFEVPKAVGASGQSDLFIGAYNGSLDAALALHQAVLPPNSTWQYYSGDGHCIVGYGPSPTDYDEAHHETPARAWLLAILKALHAQEAAP